MKLKINQVIILLLVTLIVSACSRSYSAIHFSYPPDSKPHENNWTYSGHITSWDPLGKKTTEKGEKKIVITVINKKKQTLLKDNFKLECASIDGKIKWEKFEELSIDLYERGNKFAEDEYNKKLIKNGPRHLLTLHYKWNGDKFIKSNT